MNYYRFSDLTISMTCRYDIMKRRAEKYLIPKAKENELSETTTPEIRLNPKNELIQKYILLMMTSLLFASLEIHLPYTERHLAETAMKMKT